MTATVRTDTVRTHTTTLPVRARRSRFQWTLQITRPHRASLQAGLAATLFSTASFAQEIALEPPSSPSQLRVMLHGGFSALHEEEAQNVQLASRAGGFSLAVVLDLLEVMSFAASLGTLVVDDESEGRGKSVNLGTASLAAGLRSPTIRFTEKHHDRGYPGAWMTMRYGRGFHNADYALDRCDGCDAWDMVQSDGAFFEGTLTVARLGGMLGLLAELGYRHFLDPRLHNYAATLGVGASW